MNGAPADEILLVVDGTAYFGWTALEVERSIEAMAGSFSLDLAAKERTALPDWPLAEGAACTVTLAGKTLITGWIDEIDRSLGPEERSLRIRGRDRTGDLVDCSAVNSPGSWRNRPLAAIATALLEPFGIALDVEGDQGKPFARFALQQGESVFEAIERMARYRGLVAFSRGDGRLVVGNPDSAIVAGSLREGDNVLRIEARRNQAERFSEYLVKGQSSGSDARSGASVAQVAARASDAGITRYRPLTLIGEEQSDRAALSRRAKWEAAVRSGRGHRVTATVPGWFSTPGTPWTPGRRVSVRAPSVDVDEEMLVERVRLTRDGQNGTVSEIDAVPPQAWTQLPETEPKQ
ncbi:MAG: hypothetical protein COW16_10365 [Sphingomonadales bacterium CG12_big_fil_rev_8_21_14_0_65_65_10]|nr:MAG: hypothetical protein COW16_10365 [Sphingomonadales bacterium CG12_big_fil_rev_8_21_14_0_65_65_10]